jgi:hypothetical protein
MVINDTTLIEQRRLLRPEERLLLAVFEAAYWDLKSRQSIDRRQARSYFTSDENRHAFSFMAVCQHFGWSADSIRSQLRILLEESRTEGTVAMSEEMLSRGWQAADAQGS